MGSFAQKVLMFFLLSLVMVLLVMILVFLDYTGFHNFRGMIPEELKKTASVQEYFKWAEINSLAPKDQHTKILEEKKVYVDELLMKMKLESLKILEEKEKLEMAFRELEEQKKKLENEQGVFDEKVEKQKQEELKKASQVMETRYDSLANMYSKMDPKKAGEILSENSEQSFEVLKRMKPKVLGKILETLPARDAERIVKVLQQKKS